MLAAVKEKERSRVDNLVKPQRNLCSKLLNEHSELLNGRSILLNVRSKLWNEDFIWLLFISHPTGGRSECLCVENPFGIHRQRKTGVSLRD